MDPLIIYMLMTSKSKLQLKHSLSSRSVCSATHNILPFGWLIETSNQTKIKLFMFSPFSCSCVLVFNDWHCHQPPKEETWPSLLLLSLSSSIFNYSPNLIDLTSKNIFRTVLFSSSTLPPHYGDIFPDACSSLLLQDHFVFLPSISYSTAKIIIKMQIWSCNSST